MFVFVFDVAKSLVFFRFFVLFIGFLGVGGWHLSVETGKKTRQISTKGWPDTAQRGASKEPFPVKIALVLSRSDCQVDTKRISEILFIDCQK